MTATTYRVFVYGSLLQGLHNHRVLNNAPRVAVTCTRDRYTMIDLGSFPAVLATSPDGATAAPVVGEVYEVDAHGLARLDELEGYRPHGERDSLYDRVQVQLDDGTTALMYIMHDVPPWRRGRFEVVPASDWRGYGGRRGVYSYHDEDLHSDTASPIEVL